MTEYIAVCRISRDDQIVARRDNSSVELAGYFGDYAGETYLAPDAARTFARGILALADEIDGGEAEAPTPKPALKRIPQVGDKVRVVRNAYSFEGAENVGRVGVLKETAPEDAQSHRVSFADDAYGWWCAEVEYVGDEAASTRPKVGDRVRVTDADGNHDFVGKVGTLTKYHGDDSVLPYHVTFGDGEGYHGELNGTWNCRAVEPVTDEPVTDDLETLADWERDLIEDAEAPAEPAPSPFARYVDEAKKLLTDTDHTGADVIALARELSERD